MPANPPAKSAEPPRQSCYRSIMAEPGTRLVRQTHADLAPAHHALTGRLL
jgi:hypothetical protein